MRFNSGYLSAENVVLIGGRDSWISAGGPQEQFSQGSFSPVGLLKPLDLRVGQRVQTAEIGIG